MAVYIIQFERAIGSSNPRGRAQYYVGFCDDNRLTDRLKEHASGRGAAITRYLAQNNITFDLVALIPGAGRDMEKRIKAYKNTRRVLGLIQRGVIEGVYLQ